jgi:hypothetical protein
MLTKQLHFEGGDRLKFGDVVTCVASMAVIFALIAGPLDMVFLSALGLDWGYTASFIVSLFLSAFVGGYIFAGKLWEARREAVIKITVLWAALWGLCALVVPATLADWGQKVKEAYSAANSTTLSASQWVNWEQMYLDIFVFITVVMALALGFIGLYVGSMLRKPKKS